MIIIIATTNIAYATFNEARVSIPLINDVMQIASTQRDVYTSSHLSMSISRCSTCRRDSVLSALCRSSSTASMRIMDVLGSHGG